MVLQHAEVAGAERAVRVGRREQLLRPVQRGLDRGRVLVGTRLVERGDQLRDLLQPVEAQVVRGGLQQLARAHPATEPLDLDALDLQQPPVQLEQRLAYGGGIGHRDAVNRASAYAAATC